MTQKGMDGYSSGPLHPIFAQNLPEGFNRRLILKSFQDMPRSMICIIGTTR
jgi:hypothetical protein